MRKFLFALCRNNLWLVALCLICFASLSQAQTCGPNGCTAAGPVRAAAASCGPNGCGAAAKAAPMRAVVRSATVVRRGLFRRHR